jgi:hypothetical protein
MGKQPTLYEDEMVRFMTLLHTRSWVQLIQRTAPSELTIHTTDGQVWTINSALSYARLLYLDERDDE